MSLKFYIFKFAMIAFICTKSSSKYSADKIIANASFFGEI